MIRILVLRLLLLAIPFVVYAGWRWWLIKHGKAKYNRIWAQAPTLWLFVAGVVLIVISLLLPGLLQPSPGFVQ